MVLLIGTLVVPIENSPLVVSPYWQRATPGVVVGQSEKTEKMPFGVASAGAVAARSAAVVRARAAQSVRLRSQDGLWSRVIALSSRFRLA